MKVCVWQDGKDWFWDEDEDSGLRIIPLGPFETKAGALHDAVFCLNDSITEFAIGEKPAHYP